ncbi:Hypothetical protein GLP15_4756 [Giardia lamblia P15]|uniref:Centrosomal protein POC5 n=1 Tax=Giardia intestinalis (strain P15) TaxID=658858 RepID=E1F4H3_GIAIA|nr:Hypothetical protein GLP15_4756 [Giardia lamblia P15]
MSTSLSYASILESLSTSYKQECGRRPRSAKNATVSFQEHEQFDLIDPVPQAEPDVELSRLQKHDEHSSGLHDSDTCLTQVVEPKRSQNSASFPPVPLSAALSTTQHNISYASQQHPSQSFITTTSLGHSTGAPSDTGIHSFSNGAQHASTSALPSSQNGIFIMGLDEAMHTFRRMILDAYAQGVSESVEHEVALLSKDNSILREKLTYAEQEMAKLQQEHKALKALEVHKTECCERMSDFISHLKQEKRDALMLHRLLLRWKRNARLEASHNHVVNTMDDLRRGRMIRNALTHWRLICYKKRYMRVFEDAHDAVAKVREERELYFKEERERYKQEIELLQAERNEYLVKEKGLKDQMKQAFLRGINALTDEATTALDHDGTLRGALQGIVGAVDNVIGSNVTGDTRKQTILSEQIAVAKTDCDYQDFLAGVEHEPTSGGALGGSVNHEAFLYTKGGITQTPGCGNTTSSADTFNGFLDDEPTMQGISCNYYVDDSPMNINIVQHGVNPGQLRAQPIRRQEAAGVTDPSTVRPPYMKHVRTSRGPVPVSATSLSGTTGGGPSGEAPNKFQMSDCLSKRLRSINSMTERRDNISTAMYHENLSSVKNRISVSRN